MNNIDLNINNYDYADLLQIFKLKKTDKREKIIYKTDFLLESIKKQPLLNEEKEQVFGFFYKSKLLLLAITDSLQNNIIKQEHITNYLHKIRSIPRIEKMTEIEFYNKIINLDIEVVYASSKVSDNSNGEPSLNTPYYVLNRLDPSINNRNNTNTVHNTVINELGPGNLNAVKRVTQSINLNLNSAFRANYFSTNACDCMYYLPNDIKNVTSIRLISLEIPRALYLFSDSKMNNIFQIVIMVEKVVSSHSIKIPEGNYTAIELEEYLNNTYFFLSPEDTLLKYLKFSIDRYSLKSYFQIIQEAYKVICFDLLFDITNDTVAGGSQQTIQQTKDTFGWIIGFRKRSYTANYDVVASEGLFSAGEERYIYVSLNDYQYNNDKSNIILLERNVLDADIIAKIPLKSRAQGLSFHLNDGVHFSLSKLRRYTGPINLERFHVKILDEYGAIIDLNNMDISLTFELEILYENFNFKNVTA